MGEVVPKDVDKALKWEKEARAMGTGIAGVKCCCCQETTNNA